jgi:hypothetical protein
MKGVSGRFDGFITIDGRNFGMIMKMLKKLLGC